MASQSTTYSSAYLDQSSAAQLLVVAILLIILEIAVFSVRFFYKLHLSIPWGRDDSFICLGLLSNLVQCTLSIVMIYWAGIGTHIAKNLMVDPARIVHTQQGLLIMAWTYGLGVCFPKLAILEFYLRIFPQRTPRIICYVLMGAVIATFIATAFGSTFQCTPVAYTWDPTIKGGHCIDILAFSRFAALPNIITDLVILILPMPLLLDLQMDKGRKLGLLLLFFCGGAGIVFSCVRFSIFWKTDSYIDRTWTGSLLLVFTDLEPGVYFICACLPGSYHLVNSITKRLRTVTGRRYSTIDDMRADHIAMDSVRRNGFRTKSHDSSTDGSTDVTEFHV